MRLFVDLTTQQIVVTQGLLQPVESLRVKRSPLAMIEFQFVRGSIITELPPDATGIFEVKELGKYDNQPLTAAMAWVKTGTGESAIYTFTLPLITGPLDALLGVNASPVEFTTAFGTDLFTSVGHGLGIGKQIRFSSNDTLPAPLEIDTTYYVLADGLTADAFKVGTTNGGAAVNLTDNGTGTHSWVLNEADIDEVTLMAELQWTADGMVNKSQTFDFILVNDVIREGDIAPSTPPVAYAVFIPGVTTLAEFKAIPTTLMPTGYLVQILIDVSGSMSWLTYRLAEGPATEAEPEHVEPDDYNATTNDRHWEGASGPSGVAGKSAGSQFDWSTDITATDPGSGQIKVNHGTILSATELFISEIDYYGNDISGILATWDDGTSTVRGRIFVQDPATPANFAVFDITGARTDNGTWNTFIITPVASGGTLTSGLDVYVTFTPKGDLGDTGATGTPGTPVGFPFDWSTDVTSTDPLAGKVKVNNSSLSSATELYISETSAAAQALEAYFATWDDSTSDFKGKIYIIDPGNGSNFVIYDIIGSLTDNGQWDTFPVAYVAGGGTFAADLELRLFFAPTGDKGNTGTGGSTGPTGKELALRYKFNTATGTSNPGTGKIALNNSTLSIATSLFINETDDDTNVLSAVLATWDDSTSTIKGRLFFHNATTPTIFAVFDITGTITDNGAWDTFTVTYVASGGTFTNNMPITLLFVPTGDAGATGGTTYDTPVATGTGGTPTVDLSAVSMSTLRLLAENTAVALSNPVAGKVTILHFKQAASGTAWTVTFPDVDYWVGTGGAAPVMSPGFNVVDAFTIWYDGTNLYGSWAPGA